MPSDWTATTLGECAQFFSGSTPRKSNEQYWGGAIPWFSGKDLKSFYLNDSEDHVTSDGADSGSRLMPAGTILLLVRGMTLHNDVPIGVLKRESTFNQDIKALQAKEGVQQSFLAHWLVSQKQRLLSTVHAAGHGTGVLATDRLQSLELDLPSPGEQAAIANVFDHIEDKIEQNRRTAGVLERLARAIFRAWFIDFLPVKAKSQTGRGGAAGETTFPGMPQRVFDTLPTTFEDSELGPIPQGWEVKPLDTVADFLNGLALQKFPPNEEATDLPVIKIAQLRKGNTEGASMANDSMDEKYKVYDRDLLFSWSGTLEAEFWFGGPGALNQHLFKVTSADYPLWMVYGWIHQHMPEFRLIAASKATTMGHIKRTHLKEALIATPPEPIIEAASGLMEPLYDLHANAHIESRKLAELRDYLLPRLLSGAVRVADPSVAEVLA